MEDIFRTSVVNIPETRVEQFTWDFKIAPRSKIQKNIQSIALGGFSFPGLQFKRGFLSEVDHKWSLTIYSSQINVCMILPIRDENHRYTLKRSRLQLLSSNKEKVSSKLIFKKNDSEVAPRQLWMAIWNDASGWDDSIDRIRVSIRVARESKGVCLPTLASQLPSVENVKESCKKLDTEDFFKNTHLADVIIQCRGKQYPGHRFLLSCQSPVFRRMFCEEGNSEGRRSELLVMDDVTLVVLEQFLKYIYKNRVKLSSMSEEQCKELLEVANRFEMEPLKILCEQEFAKVVTKTNCLEMYDFAEANNAQTLKEVCWNIIHLNKREVLRDRKTFKTFLAKYPDAVFYLFEN